MKGLIVHECARIFSARGKWVVLAFYTVCVMGVWLASRPFEARSVLLVSQGYYAREYMRSVNDLISLSAMVFGVVLAGKLFIRNTSDTLLFMACGRLRTGLVKWGLGIVLVCHFTSLCWFVATLLYNSVPYREAALYDERTLLLTCMFAAHGFTLFSLIAAQIKSAHALPYVLGAVFMVEIIRTGVSRPGWLSPLEYVSFVIMPSVRQASDGSLVIMTTLWLSLVIHGLFIIILILQYTVREQ